MERMPRQNQLSRAPHPTWRPLFEQVLVSNVDQIVAVFAIANPEQNGTYWIDIW